MAKFCNQHTVGDVQRNFSTPVLIAMHYLFTGIDAATDEALLTICLSLESGTPFDGLINKSPSYHVIQYVRTKRDSGAIIRAHEYINMFVWAMGETLQGSAVDGIPLSKYVSFSLKEPKFEAARIASMKLKNI